MAWQFDRPEQGEGMIEAFRRNDSADGSRLFKLHGLDPKSEYTITDVTGDKSWKATGSELMDTGLLITISEKPGVALIAYRR